MPAAWTSELVPAWVQSSGSRGVGSTRFLGVSENRGPLRGSTRVPLRVPLIRDL